MKNVKRALNNLSSVPMFNTILTKEEVNYLLDTHSDFVICRGIVRTICFDFITPDRAKVYTEKLK